MRRTTRAHDSTDGAAPADTVRDALFGGKVVLLQPAAGYRVNVDTLLLAQFAAERRPQARVVVDLGAGVGALSLSYAHLAASARYDLVERDATVAALAEHNLRDAGLQGAVHVTDVALGLPRPLRATADVVLANPPFFAATNGNERRDAAHRRARSGPLSPFLSAAAAAMGRRAYAFFAYPASGLAGFLAAAEAVDLVAKGLRFVHAYADSPARLALVELRRAKPGGLVVAAPIVEWSAQGVRSAALASLVEGSVRPRAGDRARSPRRRAR